MAEFKQQKIKQYVISPSRQPVYVLQDDYIIFNLNACFIKKNNQSRFDSLVRESMVKGGKKLNLCNLASMCYKLGMDYCSDETLGFVKELKSIAAKNSVGVVQDGIESCGEIDMQPLTSLVSYDSATGVIYTNQVLVDCFKILGYVDSQIKEVVDYTKDLRNILPPDLIEELPIKNKRTISAYNRIKDLFL